MEPIQIVTLVFFIIMVLTYVVVGVIWLFFDHGVDKIKHPEEWKDAGKAGERIVYKTLTRDFKIPENQILRNVYIPVKGGKTSEIDLLVVSKKGLFVFECKNYAGNVYGDAKCKEWIQYLGKKKSYFYSPLLQNRNHAKYLKEFLNKFEINVPIIPMVTTISRGKWKVKNLSKEDYVLGINCHLKNIYGELKDSEEMKKRFREILEKLKSLERPSDTIKKNHVNQLRNR